jgi:hypothetical protein
MDYEHVLYPTSSHVLYPTSSAFSFIVLAKLTRSLAIGAPQHTEVRVAIDAALPETPYITS